jgi:hypothetical protein
MAQSVAWRIIRSNDHRLSFIKSGMAELLAAVKSITVVQSLQDMLSENAEFHKAAIALTQSIGTDFDQHQEALSTDMVMSRQYFRDSKTNYSFSRADIIGEKKKAL